MVHMPRRPARWGKFFLLDCIEQTETDEVFRARELDSGIQRSVCLKRVPTSLSRKPEFKERFDSGIRNAMVLKHRNIVHIYNYGYLNDEAFVSMEYVDGVNLDTLLDWGKKRPLPMDLIIYIVQEVLETLAFALSCRRFPIYHLHISPRKIFLSFDGEVKLVGFGMDRLYSLSQSFRQNLLLREIAYGNPDLHGGKSPSPATDLYNVGVIWWEMLMGRPLILLTNAAEMLLEIQGEKKQELSKEFSQFKPIMDKLLELNPKVRIDSPLKVLEIIKTQGLRGCGADEAACFLKGVRDESRGFSEPTGSSERKKWVRDMGGEGKSTKVYHSLGHILDGLKIPGLKTGRWKPCVEFSLFIVCALLKELKRNGRLEIGEITPGGVSFTQAGEIAITASLEDMANPTYCSPEEEEGETPDHRSAMYRIGALLWEMTTGEKMGTAEKRATGGGAGHYPSIPWLAEDIQELLMTLLQRNPSSRYPDVETALAAIQRVNVNSFTPEMLQQLLDFSDR
jgi:serine/threonine protein kinase